MSKKSTNKALALSAIAVLACVSLLIGATFAWFTDSVTSAGNKIEAGTLQIDLEMLDGNDWVSIKEDPQPIFDYDRWEPGYTEVKVLKIVNKGSLALKWVAKFQSAVELSELADVIDVYVLTSTGEIGYPDDRDLAGYTKVGTVAQFVNTLEQTTYGSLLPQGTAGDVAYLGIALKMQESAGNQYQDLSLGGAFDIQIFATQYTYEEDSFDELYDENAWHPEMTVYTAEDLVAALSSAPAGTVVSIANDIEVNGDLVIPAAAPARSRAAAVTILDLGGNTLTADSVSAEQYARVLNGTIVLPDDGYVFASDDTAIELENVKIVSDGISAYAVRNGSVSLKDVVFENTATSNPIQNYGGTMVLENVTVAQAGDAATAWYSSAIQTINLIAKNAETGKYEILAQANTTINSGDYVGKKAIMISAPGGNVTINGGSFAGSEYAIQADFSPNNYTYGSDYTSVITINGGTFEGGFKMSKSAQLIINGGLFDTDPSAYVADGAYVVTLTVGGKPCWQVLPKSADKVYPADYESLVNGKGSSNDYVLTGDVVVGNVIYFGGNTTNTIDLNGNTITTTSDFVFGAQGAGCKLIVEGDGKVKTTAGYAGFVSSNGALTINGGTYELGDTNHNANFYVQNSGVLTINDGNFISSDPNSPIAYCINSFIEINGGFFQNTANPNAALLSMGNNIKYVNNQKITLSGGTFVNWNPMSSAFAQAWTNPDVPALIVLADGYTVVSETQDNGDVWYSVVPV